MLCCAASFSLDGSLVAAAVYHHNQFMIYVFFICTGAEVKLLHTQHQQLGLKTRLCFEATRLYFVADKMGANSTTMCWDLDTWKPVPVEPYTDLGKSARFVPPAIHLAPTSPTSFSKAVYAANNPADSIILAFRASDVWLQYPSHNNYPWRAAWNRTKCTSIHYRSDLRTVWIACDCATSWVLFEVEHGPPPACVWRRTRRRIELPAKPHDIAVSSSGQWLVLAGPKMLVRLNRFAASFQEHDATTE
jgi:hypothetical protein